MGRRGTPFIHSYKILLLILFNLCCLVSCNYSPEINDSSTINNPYSSSSSPIIKHYYSELSSNYITWNDIFNNFSDEYYVYIFSTTCSKCKEIETEIVEFGLENRSNFYLIKDPENPTYIKEVNLTIGLSSYKDFGIAGVPTLLKIMNGKIENNVAGKTSIFLVLNIS